MDIFVITNIHSVTHEHAILLELKSLYGYQRVCTFLVTLILQGISSVKRSVFIKSIHVKIPLHE